MLKKFLFFIFLSANGFSTYAELDLAKQVEKKIKTQSFKKNSLTLIISKIQTDNKIIPIYSLNEKNLFAPASLVKIAVLSALYHYYPLDYTFKTSFLSSAIIKEGTLQGDLVLKGGGDPGFTSESLWNLVNVLTRSHIKKIKGDLLVDASLYTKKLNRPPSERSYNAPVSASSFNWNSTAFYIRPAKTLKAPATVFADPENSYIQIINNSRTGKKNTITVKRRAISSTKEVFEIKGEIDIQKKEIIKYRNITQPAFWMGQNALSFLKQRGIIVSGEVKTGACSGTCKTLAEWESWPFAFHSYNLMKYSSNFIAKMLVSHLPLLDGKSKGDLKEGMKKLRNYLQQVEGIQNFRLEEPSGLSRKNRMASKDLLKLLIRSRKAFYGPEMLFSYPLSKGKGTLNKRFKDLSPSSFVRAKTGSLSGVLGLAGYAGSLKSKEVYVFVFIFNGKTSKAQQAEKLFDEIAGTLSQ